MTETIVLDVDFRKSIPQYSTMLEKWPPVLGRFKMKYSIEFHLNGETLTYLVKVKDKYNNTHALHLDQRGTIDCVTLTGDCPTNLGGQRFSPSSSASTERTDTTLATDDESYSLRTPIQEEGYDHQHMMQTPDSSLYAQPQFIVNSPSDQLLQDANEVRSESNPFSTSYPRQDEGLKKPPSRKRNKPKRFQEKPASQTPVEPRSNQLDSIGLPRLADAIGEISLSSAVSAPKNKYTSVTLPPVQEPRKIVHFDSSF
ncbi:hypothetical protein NHQ30_008896 [Ciborinia camelliae]|nr:hypothetical protein NHQ30_008896 [Ciborinia camelliae]